MRLRAQITVWRPIPWPMPGRLASALSSLVSALQRRLPFIREPVLGESFPSWLDRTSAALQAPSGVVAQAIGLPIRRYHKDSVPAMYGIAMSRDVEGAASAATGLARSALHGMHLACYDGGVLDLAELDPADERTLRLVARREWVLLHGSRVCPLCLAESGGVWQLHWKLSITAVCVTHGLLMLDDCPDCAVPLRRTSQGGPSALSMLRPPDPTSCFAGRYGCGADLTSAVSDRVGARIVQAQHRLLTVVDGHSAALGGSPLSTPKYFERVRALAAAVRFAADPALLPSGTPAAISGGFAAHIHRADGSGGGNIGYRTRPLTAAASAAVLAVLADAILASSQDELDRAIAPVAAAVCRARTLRGHNPLRGMALPDALRARPEPFVGRVAGALERPVVQPAQQPRWIPQIVDQESYQLVAKFLPGTFELTGRRFTALAVACVAGARSWAQAARWTGWPVDLACQTADVVARRITQVDEFWEAARRVTARLAANGTDWRERRREVERLIDVDPRRLGQARSDGAPWTASRRHCAAAWAWASYTGGDWRAAPAMSDPRWPASTESRRELYRRFSRLLTPRLADALVEYAVAGGRNPR